MAALTRDRLVSERQTGMAEFPITPGIPIFRGAMVAIDVLGNALRPQDLGAAFVVGVANTSSAEFFHQAGINPGALPTGIVQAPVAATTRVRHSTQFAMFNSAPGADLVSPANWGATLYAVDDQTVALTNGGGLRLAAGICRGVDADGVWVQFP